MAGPRILIVDDEPNLRRVLAATLAREGYEVVQAAGGAEAVALLDPGLGAIITDLRMPDVDGLALLRRAVVEVPGVPVIILTAFGSVDSAVAAVKAGAFDYLEKPCDIEPLRLVVAKAVRQGEAERHHPRTLGTGAAPARGRFGLVGESGPMRAIYSVIEKVASSPSTVLITGESGTGKELVARALHESSGRKGGPFIKINCAAIPKNLMESELFGYEKGAFTGAVSSKPGRFELADGGTLFLDEIGEIPVEMQVKLLRALQESEFERVGGLKTIKVSVRLVAATNRDLEREVRAGGFREDLYYRLNVVPIHVPPLRDRREDVPLLVDHILTRFGERLGRPVSQIEPDAVERLTAHSWPGNIRELENVLERTILFAEGPRLRARDLPPEIGGAIAATSASSGSGSTSSLKDLVRLETERVEREQIVRALEETRGNVTQAAKRLGISRKSLQLKMKDFGLREKSEE